MKNDIRDRKDVRQLVLSFYERLMQDQEFEHIFLQVAEIDVLAHLDIQMDFWDSALFQTKKYKGDTLEVHLEVHHRYRLKAAHFKRWLEIFNATVDDLFVGEKATEAKHRALTMASIIKVKIDNLEQRRLEINN